MKKEIYFLVFILVLLASFGAYKMFTKESSYLLFVKTYPLDAAISIIEPQKAYQSGIKLHPGRYLIDVQAPGYESRREWIEITDENIEITILLEKNRYSLFINVHPAKAEVSIIAPIIQYNHGIKLLPGEYLVRVQMAGYQSKEQLIRIDETDVEKTIILMKWLYNDPVTGMKFLWVSGNCYDMGCGDWAIQCFGDEKPVQEICLDGFWMGKYEVTQGQWKKVMGSNPSYFNKGDNYPVETISWVDIQEFIQKLNVMNPDWNMRLPTESEWEYAARSSGLHEIYSGGMDPDPDPFAWYMDNSNKSIQPTGRKKPNGLGLYDMSGNVQEWVESLLPVGGGAYKLTRGGSWSDPSRNLRTTHKDYYRKDHSDSRIGFRLVTGPVED